MVPPNRESFILHVCATEGIVNSLENDLTALNSKIVTFGRSVSIKCTYFDVMLLPPSLLLVANSCWCYCRRCFSPGWD